MFFIEFDLRAVMIITAGMIAWHLLNLFLDFACKEEKEDLEDE